jgi:CubicO group peptidase (beta-lactamase class C family)
MAAQKNMKITTKDGAAFARPAPRRMFAMTAPARQISSPTHVSNAAEKPSIMIGLFPRDTYPSLPGWSDRNQWWVSHDAHGVYMARGIHGQSIYVDPTAEVVIARYASHPAAGNVANDPVTLPAFRAVCRALIG